jgi:hypothetical protein
MGGTVPSPDFPWIVTGQWLAMKNETGWCLTPFCFIHTIKNKVGAVLSVAP